MGYGHPSEDLGGGRDLCGKGKSSVCERYGDRFRMVEWFDGEHQPGDGILYGRDGACGVTGHCGWDGVYGAPDVQLGAWFIAYDFYLIAPVRGNGDAVCLLVLE